MSCNGRRQISLRLLKVIRLLFSGMLQPRDRDRLMGPSPVATATASGALGRWRRCELRPGPRPSPTHQGERNDIENPAGESPADWHLPPGAAGLHAGADMGGGGIASPADPS